MFKVKIWFVGPTAQVVEEFETVQDAIEFSMGYSKEEFPEANIRIFDHNGHLVLDNPQYGTPQYAEL